MFQTSRQSLPDRASCSERRTGLYHLSWFPNAANVHRPWSVVLALVILAVTRSLAVEDAPHLTSPQIGGIPGLPIMTGIERTTNGVEVTWYGPPGYYQLFQKVGITDPAWKPIGGLTLSNHAVVPLSSQNPLFRVTGPSPQYAGDRSCSSCHEDAHAAVSQTQHARAFNNPSFRQAGGQTNMSCLPCHAVGAGLPTGFNPSLKTSHLSGVQCESCHGPAGRHAASPEDFTARPRVELAAAMCGGCHNAGFAPSNVRSAHRSHYEDWRASEHAVVPDEVRKQLTSSSATTALISECGRCHSGAVRSALYSDASPPRGAEATALGITCASCHETHQVRVHENVLHGVVSFTNILTGGIISITNQMLGARYTNQLREPLASLQDYHATGAFATNYNANINGCAQCHNDRGDSFLASDHAPHHSPQYNMLLGTVGELTSGSRTQFPSTHSRLEKQCVTCHMQRTDTEVQAVGTSGHQFKVSAYDTCATCHGSAENAQAFAGFVKTVIQSLTGDLKASLDRWALTRAATPLRKYGALAWEYQAPGSLSDTNGSKSGPVSAPQEPSRDEQHLIPLNIRKARFNLYVVLNDGSYGVHNGPYAISLLSAARSWVDQESTQPATP